MTIVYRLIASLLPKKAERTTAPRASTGDGGSDGVTISVSMGAGGSVTQKCKPGRYYVYVHKEENGRVFYVGKGTERRAWSKERDAEWHQHVSRLGGKYIIEILRRGISEEDARQIEDAVMAQHGNTILNLQNLHAPWDSQKWHDYERAMGAYDTIWQDATRFATANEHEIACLRFEEAYAAYVEAQQFSNYRLGARMTPEQFPPLALVEAYTKYLRRIGQLDRVVAFSERVDRDFPGSENRPAILALWKSADRVKTGKKVSVGPKIAAFVPPDVLPPDWERTKEGSEVAIRLKRNLRLPNGSHYLSTVGPLKQLRREGRYDEALALMKAAIVDEETRSARKHEGPPSFYYAEAAKACRDLGDFLQECLVLQRYLDRIKLSGRDDLALFTRLGVAAAKYQSARSP